MEEFPQDVSAPWHRLCPLGHLRFPNTSSVTGLHSLEIFYSWQNLSNDSPNQQSEPRPFVLGAMASPISQPSGLTRSEPRADTVHACFWSSADRLMSMSQFLSQLVWFSLTSALAGGCGRSPITKLQLSSLGNDAVSLSIRFLNR